MIGFALSGLENVCDITTSVERKSKLKGNCGFMTTCTIKYPSHPE